MPAAADPFTLAHWRRIVSEHYAAVRAASPTDAAAAAMRFRAVREQMFRDHPQSPIAAERRRAWGGLGWHPYDPAWRVIATVDHDIAPNEFEIALAADGLLRCARAGVLHFVMGGEAAALTAYWIEGYGGGLWLPFADASNGGETYGGGRYLYDTIKGADLGGGNNDLVLDFNFAYNPSCAYDERWSCPLSPPENRLPFAVTAGERMA